MAMRDGYSQLREKVLAARRVWKRTLFWTGCAIVLVGLIAILAGEAVVDLLMPLPSGIRAVLLIGTIGAVGYTLYRYVVQPVRTKLTLRDVALNVERQHPELEDRLVSALQFGDRNTDDPIEAHMLQRLVTDAAEHADGMDFNATVDKTRKHKYLGIAVSAIALSTLLLLIFPFEINTTLHRLLVPWEKTSPALATRLNVQPGNARIPRGQSLRINVEIAGKGADKVRLDYTRMNRPSTVEGVEPDRHSLLEQQVNMVQVEGEKDKFEYEIFNINEDMQYYVLANNTESERYNIEVFDIPRVIDISVSYTYPEYTQMKPVVQQGDGNIHAAAGTAAEIRITTNKAIESAILTVADNNAIPMVISEGRTLTAALDVIEDGKYSVELHCVNGLKNQTPIEYSIRAIPDNPPEVVIREPGRDIKATKLEEVQVIVEAIDDYKVEAMALRYTIGSGAAQELPIETVDVGAKKAISGSYNFYLEELNVEPGDVISYYAQATDNNTGTGISQIHFIEVRPFNERYEEAEAGSAACEILAGLVAEQKQIIKETWGHINSRPRFDSSLEPAPPTDDYKFAVKKTGDRQAKLKDRVQRFVDEISTAMRTTSIDPEILINFEEAIDKMRKATHELDAIKPREAMPQEQDALESLVKVEMALPKALTRMRGSGNREVADNIDVEMEALQSEFEEDENELDEQMREQVENALNQARGMLAEQEQLTQQCQQMGRGGQPSQGETHQNSQQQGKLAQDARQMSQQLSQMTQQQGESRQNARQDVAQASRAMQQASEQMQEAAQNMSDRKPQMSAAKGQKAEENLQQAIEALEKTADRFTEDTLEKTTEQLDRLIAKQSEIRERTATLDNQTKQNGMDSEDLKRASQLAHQQQALQQNLDQVQHSLVNLQEKLSENNSQAARNVLKARHRIIEEEVSETMASAQHRLRWRTFKSAEADQRKILDTLLQVREDLQQAKANMSKTEEEQLEIALEQLEHWQDRMRDIQRELEAMDSQASSLTPEQEQRQQQLSELQAQMQQRVQELQHAMEAQLQRARAGMQSDQEIKELWLGLIDAMDMRRGSRSAPFPNYDFALRELNKLKDALEDRLIEIQEKKRLSQVLREDVPPEYRTLVDSYYESLAQ